MVYRFLCDATVIKLAKWMRFLGIDTLIAHEYKTKALLDIAKKENRIILTRNRRFLKIKSENIHVLKSDFLFEELREVIITFRIKHPALLTRCSKCNTVLLDVEKEKVKGKVPYFTFKHHNEFKFCPVCNKIYWKGSHINLMIERLKKEEIWELLF